MAIDFETPEDIAQKIGEFKQHAKEQNLPRWTLGREVASAFHYDPVRRPWQQRVARLRIMVTDASASFYAVLKRENREIAEMTEIDLSPVYNQEKRRMCRELAGSVRGEIGEMREWVNEGAVYRVSEVFYELYRGLEEHQISPDNLNSCVDEAYGLNGFIGCERPLQQVINEERAFTC